MKRILTITAIAAIGFAAFTGCKKSSSGASSTYNMKATIGSTAYNAPNCLAVQTGTQMVIEGLGGTSTVPTFPYMALILTNWNSGIVTATFNFDSTMLKNYAQYLSSSTSAIISKTGSVNVTSVTSTAVSGNFSFTGTDGTVVSGGTFTAQIQK